MEYEQAREWERIHEEARRWANQKPAEMEIDLSQEAPNLVDHLGYWDQRAEEPATKAPVRQTGLSPAPGTPSRTLLALLPSRSPGGSPTKYQLQRQRTRTLDQARSGYIDFNTLAKTGRSTRLRKWRPNTVAAKRTAAKSWDRFCKLVRLDDQVLDPSKLTHARISDVIDAYCAWAGDSLNGKHSSGFGLPSTVTTYASACLDLHQMLPEPINLEGYKLQLREWRKGRYSDLVGAFGSIRKRQKAGITRRQIKLMMDTDWNPFASKPQAVVMKSAIQMAFQMMLRRSEYTGDSRTTFSPTTQMTRASVEWFRTDGSKCPLDIGSLQELRRSQEGYCMVTVATSKCDPRGEWGRYPVPLSLRGSDTEVKAANYYLDVEILDPVSDMTERQNIPLFRDPDTGHQLLTGTFDDVVIKVLHQALVGSGVKITLEEVRELWSLHSLRIGGVNALKKAGVDRETRMILGRWKSSAIDTYDRPDREYLQECMKIQDVDCDLYTPLANDMPRHREAEDVPYGEEYEVETVNNTPVPKAVPEISIEEVLLSHNSMGITLGDAQQAQRAQAGTGHRTRSTSHPLIGRTVEMMFQMEQGGETSFQGRIEQIESEGDKPVRVKFVDGEVMNYTIEETYDSLMEVSP